ncbi:MAG: Ig-like domain-containing protein [Pseudomonadota bacterium]
MITESVSALIDSDGLVTIDPGVFADDLAVGESEVLTFDYTATDGIESITGGLEITINGANDPLAAVNDLPTESRATGFFLNGNVSGDRAGYAFTDLGDVNGDGFTDLAVSAPNGTPGSFPNAGYSYIVFGGPDIDQFSSLDLQSLDGSNGFRFDGFSGGLYAGTSLANAGDVNGDGLDDILIGARENYYGEAGRSFVVFGAANLGSGGIIELDEFNFVDGVNAFQIVADNAISPGFLNQVQSVGDLNDDGFDDVAVSFQGAEFPDGESGRETATTYIIFGTDQAVDGGTLNLSDIDGSNGFFVQAPDGPYTSFAYSMTAGDINGDGIDDLIIGDDTASGSSGYGGAVFVILGATDLGPAGGGAAAEFELGNFDFGNLDGSNGFAITPAEDGEGLGRGVSAIGDINGDGLDDLVLSSYRGFFDNTQDNYVGRVQVVFGATDLGSTSGGTFGLANYSAQTLNMISLNERFLGKVDILGDVNGDGFDDLLISVASGEFATDTAFLVFGSETLAGQTINLDTLDGTDGYRLAAPTTSNNLARGAGAGDLNNDGLADLVFGDPGFDDGQRFNVGQAAVVFGGATSLAVLDALDGTTNGLIDLGLLGGFLAGSLTTDEDTVLSFVGADLLANDFDPSGNPISIQSVDTVSAAGASVAFDGTTVSYDPGVLFQGLSLGESATDTFTYTITAGGQTATATATVQIDGANDAPSAPATLALQAHRTDRDDVLGPQPGDVTDPDQNDALIFTAELGDGVPLPSLLEGAFSTTDGTFSLGVGVGDGGDEGLYRIESTVTDGATTPLDFGYYIAIHDVDTVGSVGGENLVTSGDGVVSDLIFGGGGRDRLQGGNGADIYVYRSGDDADVVDDYGFSGQDAVLFEDYSLADAIFARFLRDQNELLIDLPDADSLRIVDALGDSGADVIESYAFSDGATISVATLRQLLLDEERTAGKDRLIGFDGANALTLEGDLGDDLLSGRNGSDTYLYTLGDGSDLISEGGFRDTDVVEISGTTLEATALKRGAFASNDLVIQFSDGGEIRIVNTLNGSQTDQVEQVVFAEEAATLGAQDLRDILIEQVQSAGDDAVIGFNQIDDTLQGGAGDDFLSGLSASDLYLYNASGATDGNDTIFDNGFAGTDVLQIDGIESTSLAFRRLFNTDDLLVDITDGSGGILSTITIVDAIDGNENDEIEEIVTTNDQTTLTAAGIRDILIDGEESAGQTTITGFSISADTILANGGERVLTGFNQGDTYQVDSSSDDVVIVDDGFAGTDRLELLFIDDPVRAFRAQGDLDDLFIDTNNQIIRIVDGLEGNNGATIEVVQEGALGDVTIADLRARLVQETNTAGDDRIIGTTFSDTIDLDIGTDFIDLRSGVDSLTYSAETGDKIVTTALQAGSNGDTLTFADFATTEVDIHVSAFAANAVSFDFDFGIGEVTLVNGRDARAFEVIVFVDQTFTGAEIGAAIDAAATPIDLITGDNDANTLTAGAPAEDRVALQGLGGNDLYEIVVDPTGGTVSASFVEIFEGGVGDDVLSIIGTDASGVSFGRVQSDLDGASNLDVLDEGDLLITTGVGEVLVHQAFQGNNTIETFRFTNTVEGLASVDLTLAEVQEIIIGNEFTLGDDTILGFNGADTIATQAGGSDVLRGLNGADLYQITDNAENFVVIDDAGGGDADVVEFQGSSLAESAFSRVNGDRDDLLVTDSFDREILIRDTLDDNFNGGIATLRFDGADVTMADVRTLLLAADETSGSDTIIGFRTADTISVASGDDVLNGRDGADVYEIDGAGFGDVLIDDQGGGDADTVVILNTARSSASFARDPVRQDTLLIRLDGGKTITIRDTLSDNFSGGIASITFDNAGNVQTLTMLDIRSELLNGLATEGDDQIVGFSTDDTLDGGTGNDALRGGDGSDVYIFGLDSGRDRIDDNGSFDTDVLDIGVSFAQIQLSRGGVTGEDIILDIADTDDRVTVVEGFRDGQNNGIEEFQFTDQTLTTLDLRALLLAGETSAGADTIVGFGGADTLIGGAGNDQLLGEGGDDLYIFRVGDGADIINDTPTNGSNNDRIDFDGFTLADASFSLLTPTQNHILVELSSGDQVTVIEGSGANGRIETYEFDDQTLTLAEVEALL